MDFFEKLGIGFPQIIFYAVTLIILVTALYFLLFKPVKKMMAAHRKKLDDICEENKRLASEAEGLQAKYDGMVEDFKAKSSSITIEATKAAEAKSEHIVEDAKNKANAILAEASKDVDAEKIRRAMEYKETVSHLAVDIAEKILAREISENDNKKIIDECLDEWNKNV